MVFLLLCVCRYNVPYTCIYYLQHLFCSQRWRMKHTLKAVFVTTRKVVFFFLLIFLQEKYVTTCEKRQNLLSTHTIIEKKNCSSQVTSDCIQIPYSREPTDSGTLCRGMGDWRGILAKLLGPTGGQAFQPDSSHVYFVLGKLGRLFG